MRISPAPGFGVGNSTRCRTFAGAPNSDIRNARIDVAQAGVVTGARPNGPEPISYRSNCITNLIRMSAYVLTGDT
jgi:hypothetical protein